MARIPSVAVVCISLFVAAAAHADADDETSRFELAALVGYRGGGEFDALTGAENPRIRSAASYGVSLGWYREPQTKYELLYDMQSTQIEDNAIDLDVEHLHLGGALPYNATDTLTGYISGGLGATRFNPSSGDDETRFSVSLALGVDLPFGEHFGVRLEARGYLVWMDGNSEIFCSSDPVGGTCLVRAAADHLIQYALISAFGFRF